MNEKDLEAKFEEMREELDPAQVAIIKIEQQEANCELNHGGDPRGLGPYPAHATMTLKHENGFFPLHVCEVCCIDLLNPNSDWYLFVCFGCGSTVWTHKNNIRRNYTKQIVGMNECPNCADRVGVC